MKSTKLTSKNLTPTNIDKAVNNPFGIIMVGEEARQAVANKMHDLVAKLHATAKANKTWPYADNGNGQV